MKQELFDTIIYIAGLISFILLFAGLVVIEKKREINDKDLTDGGYM